MDFQSVINRQLGLRTPMYYDSVLRRLMVSKNDNMSWTTATFLYYDAVLPPIFACRFAETPGYEHILAAANEIGEVDIKDTLKMGNKSDQAVRGYNCHSNAIFDLAWMHHDNKIITVSGDHTCCLWDVTTEMKSISFYSGHERSIKTATFRYEDDAVFATGARDGNIFIWDVRCQTDAGSTRPDGSIPRCHPILNTTPASGNKRWIEPGRNSITSLAFQNDMTLISCGAGDGYIKVWDLRKNYSVFTRSPLSLHSIPYCGNFRNKCGYTNLIIDKSRCRLYAACMDNVIYCFNISTYNTQPDIKYIGHSSATFYIKNSLSPDGKYLVSGSSDENAYIWNINYREPIVKLVGHSAEVTCATWCNKGEVKIVTCSDDASIKIWRVGKEWLDCDDKVDLRGTAEVVDVISDSCSLLETTPQQNKKRPATSDITPSSRFKRTCRRNSSSVEKSTRSNKNIKRSLIDILNSDSSAKKKVKRDILSPISEENVCDQKDNLGLCFLDWKSSDPDSHQKHLKLSNSDKVLNILSENLHTKPLLKTPTKSKSYSLSTAKENNPHHSVNVQCVKFPDFVSDGSAPHKSLMSPRKKRSGTDWLTAIVEEKKIKLEDIDLSFNTNGSNSSTQIDILSPSNQRAKVRRNSSHEVTPKRAKPKCTLYKFFQVLSNNN